MRAVAGIALAGVLLAGCSTAGADLPLTRAADVATQQPDRASTSNSLGPLDQRFAPDVLVRLPAPFDAPTEHKLVDLVPAGHASVLRSGPVPVAAPSGSATVSVAGVDPAAFRRFTPKNTAEVTGVWDNIARGSVSMSYEASKRLGVPLGGKVTLAAQPFDVGALADTGMPDIDVVVSNDVANRLGLPPANSVVLAGGTDDPTPLALNVRKAVTKTARVDMLRSPAQKQAFFNSADARRRLGTLTYSVAPDGKVSVDPKWVETYIVTATVPIMGRMTCHRAIIPQLTKALNEIEAAGLADKLHPDQYEGCYWPKLIEDSQSLSMHAWGLAFDLNVPTNQRLTHGDMDPGVVAIFKKWGFRWGGDWKGTPDPMHFELASLLNV